MDLELLTKKSTARGDEAPLADEATKQNLRRREYLYAVIICVLSVLSLCLPDVFTSSSGFLIVWNNVRKQRQSKKGLGRARDRLCKQLRVGAARRRGRGLEKDLDSLN